MKAGEYEMILDKAENLELYAGLHRHMPAVIRFIRDFLAAPGADGRYEICGEEAYANVFGKDNGPDGEKRFETHDRYIDLQLVLEGGQTIYWADRDGLQVSEAYCAERDITFYAPAEGLACGLRAGQFLYLLPTDGHRPDCGLEGERFCRKMVVKLAVR